VTKYVTLGRSPDVTNEFRIRLGCWVAFRSVGCAAH
jgi:hypothetical protein